MLALVDADYKFIWANVTHYGSNSVSQLFLDCDLHQHLEDGTLRIPLLVGDTTSNRKDVPYFIVVDDAFSPQLDDEAICTEAPYNAGSLVV